MTLRSSRIAAGAMLFGLLAASLAGGDQPAQGQEMWVYVGTYNQHGSKGIYRFDFDPATGKLSGRTLAAEATNPSFLAIAPDCKHLYSVDEVADFNGKKSGAVSAFAIEPDGGLKRLNAESSMGTGPCHLVADKAGKHVLAANYGSGSACVLPIGEDGKLGPATSSQQHKGTSVNPQRQEGPHAHSINLDAANRFAVVADLGLDKVFVYRYDADKGTITPNEPPATKVTGGSGPRHFAFHPNGKNAYVINEMTCTVTAFNYDAEKGVLTEIQTLPTLPRPVQAGDSTAEVQVHPSGKFLYGSNRGHNSIAVFKIDADGKLTHVGNESTHGKTPRNFGIDPTGNWLIAANQDSDTLVVFRVDTRTGELTSMAPAVEVPMPVCVKFLPVSK